MLVGSLGQYPTDHVYKHVEEREPCLSMLYNLHDCSRAASSICRGVQGLPLSQPLRHNALILNLLNLSFKAL